MTSPREVRVRIDCIACGDTRRRETPVPGWCQLCPTPCDRCEGEDRSDGMLRGTGYCAAAPCACECHR